MKRSLVVLLLIVLISVVLGQQTDNQQTKYRRDPPTRAEFPTAGRSCLRKHKMYFSAVAGVPVGSVKGTAKVSCQFHSVDCRGVSTPHHSEPRLPPSDGSEVCAAWVAARDALDNAAIESCCDPPDESENEPPSEAKCDQPKTPWFDNSVPCKEERKPWVAVQKNEVVVTICGVEIFRNAIPGKRDPLQMEAYRQVVIDEIKSKIGSTICCDKFRDAVRTAVPCDPSKDLDCDGKPNATDVFSPPSSEKYVKLPEIDIYSRRAGARIDPFPEGLNPDDPDFLPNRTARDSKNVGDCPCKWELTKGELKCSPDGSQRHVYIATWRCPVTGAEVITTKYASAQTNCP